ncbi:MAG: FAD:protein FMN transferase [Planctomycetes bacterium]|nr:FAD:protein FMN transferase [Planctomycetota bacterium]
MACEFELALPDSLPPVHASTVAEEAFEVVRECEARWSRFRSDSYLAFLEREAPRRAVVLDADAFAIFEVALRVWRESQGAFDVAWRSAGGSSAAIALDRGARTIRFHAPLALDLGALAKGHALDLAREHLAHAGIERALLHGGTSSVAALGGGWKVALAGSARVLELADECLSLSGQRGRAHVVDPRTRNPVERGGLAWVRAPSGLLAEAWSTAALVLGYVPDSAAITDHGFEDEEHERT